jgi:hypothetical protein
VPFPLNMRFLLALRAIFFVLLLPGTVAGYIPFGILSTAGRLRAPELSLSSVGASILAIAGTSPCSAASGTSSPRARVLSHPSTLRECSSYLVSIALPEIPCTTAFSHSPWARRGSSVACVSLNEGIDATTPAGKLQMHILGAIAEFERARIAERVKAGLQRARAQGKRLGRPRKARATIAIPGGSVREAARIWGVSKSTAARWINAGQLR